MAVRTNTGRSEFDRRFQPRHGLDDSAASATLALGTRDALAQLRAIINEVAAWAGRWRRGETSIQTIPLKKVETGESIVDTLLVKYQELSEPPYRLIFKLERAKRFFEGMRVLPRRVGERVGANAGPGQRYREVHTTELDISLQRLAAKHLGSPAAADRLAAMNATTPHEWAQESPDGKTLKVPADEAPPYRYSSMNPVVDYLEGTRVLGSSIKSEPGAGPEIDATTGDYKIVEGYDNYRQELLHRFITLAGELDYAPWYGSRFARLVGSAQSPYVEEAMLRAEFRRVAMHDPRTAAVFDDTKIIRDQDAVHVEGKVLTVVGAAQGLAFNI